MITRDNVTRYALAVALVVLAAVFAWVGLTRPGGNGPLPWYASALAPLAAAGLLRIRPVVGLSLALVAALYGALLGLLLQFCLFCAALPTLTAESVALFSASTVVFGLAVVEFRRRGMVWVVLMILSVGLLFSNNILAAGLIAALAIAWFVIQRRRAIS